MEIKAISSYQLRKELGEGLLTYILFGGSRILFIDEILAAYEGTTFFGAISISPFDEFRRQNPSIIGILVLKKWRKMGIGTKLLKRAILRMEERSLTPIHIDILSRSMKRLIDRIDPRLQKNLVLNDMSEYDCFDKLEDARLKGVIF